MEIPVQQKIPALLVLLATSLLLAGLPTSDVSAGDRVTGETFATRSEVIARHGMAATSQPLAWRRRRHSTS